MAQVSRYIPELISAYERGGYWFPEFPVDYWERNARRFPEREALVYHSQRFTWAQAAQAIDKLALGLVRCGLAKDDILALHATNSASLLLMRLAAEKAGVISLLVPPSFSRLEVEAITKQVPLSGVMLGHRERAKGLDEIYLAGSRGRPFVLLDVGESHTEGVQCVNAWLSRPCVPADVVRALVGRRFEPYEYAAITTTSGTTGTPRFVEHAACARSSAGRVYIDRLNLGPQDNVVAMTSIFAGNCDLLLYHTAPQVGAKAILLDHFEPEAACRLIEAEEATCAIFVPTLLHRLLAFEGLRDYDLSTLRIVTSFGAVLPREKAAQVERVLGVKVIQGYGASDYGALASTAIDDPEHLRLSSVGRPLTGTELRICDEAGVELEPGAYGRIYARGPHCVGGYVGDPDATAKAWELGYYCMGDLGRVDDQGYLWLGGRTREIIIRGGQNVFPADVEDVILCHPDVAEVSVIGLFDAEMGERIGAVVVTRNGARVTLESLAGFLRDRGLARFKVPEKLMAVDAMPLNPAGTKIDKRTLRRLLTDAEEQDESVSRSPSV